MHVRWRGHKRPAGHHNEASVRGLDGAKDHCQRQYVGMAWPQRRVHPGAAGVTEVQFGAERTQIEVGTKPCGNPGYHDRVLGRIARRLTAGRAPDVLGEHLDRLEAEVANQHLGAGRGPEGEVCRTMLADFKLTDPREKPVDHGLAEWADLWVKAAGSRRCRSPSQSSPGW